MGICGKSGGNVVERSNLSVLLTGTHQQTIDDRGRIPFPAKLLETFRELAGVGPKDPVEVIVSITPQQRLGVFPKKTFMEIIESLEEPSKSNQELEALKLSYLNSMSEATLDKQNRFRIPAMLAEVFGLMGEVVVLGSGEYIEVVNKDTWKAQFLANMADMKSQSSVLKQVTGAGEKK